MAKKVREKTFEEYVIELEKIVASLEAGEVPLEKSLSLFEEGTKLSKKCLCLLEDAQKRIDGQVKLDKFLQE